MPLTDRASIKRAMYRLTNTDDNDAAQIEHDDSTLEGVYLLLEEGLLDAQLWLLTHGFQDRWLKVTSAVTVNGVDTDAEGRYVTLPSDFLRLAGDRAHSALFVPGSTGRIGGDTRWGREVVRQDGLRTTGDYFWLENDRIRLGKSATVPAGLVINYYYRPAALVDGTDVDFPQDDRALIPAFAAVHAMEASWYPGDMEQKAAILRNLERRKLTARKRARRSRQPQKFRVAQPVGSHFILQSQ